MGRASSWRIIPASPRPALGRPRSCPPRWQVDPSSGHEHGRSCRLDEAIADLELHRQDPSRRRRGGGLLLGFRFSHWRVVSSHESCSIASEQLRTSSRSRRALASC